jgi:hypothetical protein
MMSLYIKVAFGGRFGIYSFGYERTAVASITRFDWQEKKSGPLSPAARGLSGPRGETGNGRGINDQSEKNKNGPAAVPQES